MRYRCECMDHPPEHASMCGGPGRSRHGGRLPRGTLDALLPLILLSSYEHFLGPGCEAICLSAYECQVGHRDCDETLIACGVFPLPQASASGLPVIVDGFISGTAALLAQRLDPSLKRCLFWSHRGEEEGCRAVLHEAETVSFATSKTALIALGSQRCVIRNRLFVVDRIHH